jgi:hypothetical protein
MGNNLLIQKGIVDEIVVHGFGGVWTKINLLTFCIAATT